MAAGDVAFMRTAHGVQRSPIWTNAIEQAKTAAAALISPGDGCNRWISRRTFGRINGA